MTLTATVLVTVLSDVDLDSFKGTHEPTAFLRQSLALNLILQKTGANFTKNLGNGVLAVFLSPIQALLCASVVLKGKDFNPSFPSSHPTCAIKAGICTGPIEVVNEDFLGDAVNVAFRLSELAALNEIWADLSESVLFHVPVGLRCEHLGAVPIRGRTELCSVLKFAPIELPNAEQTTELGNFQTDASNLMTKLGSILLSHRSKSQRFQATQMPIRIGRDADSDFPIINERVSRKQAIIEWRHQGPVVVDVSSFGTWVRFHRSEKAIFLKREFCELQGEGELILSPAIASKDSTKVFFRVMTS